MAKVFVQSHNKNAEITLKHICLTSKYNNMKKLFLLGAMVCTLILSCSKPEEETPASIVGDWKCTSYTHQILDLDYDTIIVFDDEVNREWRFTVGENFYIDGEKMGTYYIEEEGQRFDWLRLYYEISEPYYHVDIKTYGALITKKNLHLNIIDAMYVEEVDRIVPVSINIDFTKID